MRRPCDGLSACGLRKVGSHVSAEVMEQCRRNVRPVTVALVRVRCTHMHGIYSMACANAHLTRAASAGDGDAGDGGSGRASAPSHVVRPAVAACGDGRECMATCQGKSGRLERARLPIGSLTSAPRRRSSSLCACGDAVSVCTRVSDGADARPVQRGGSQSELVWASKRYDVCTYIRI